MSVSEDVPKMAQDMVLDRNGTAIWMGLLEASMLLRDILKLGKEPIHDLDRLNYKIKEASTARKSSLVGRTE